MKSLLIFLLGVGLGAAGWHSWTRARTSGDVAATAAGATHAASASAQEIGGELSDASIIARIKGRYVVERDLSAMAITVESKHGRVTLTGKVGSAALAARAAEIARNTGGVVDVTTRLTVEAETPDGR